MVVISNIVSALDKLPNKDEFDAVKKELEGAKEAIDGVANL
jgi:hypothetical protein